MAPLGEQALIKALICECRVVPMNMNGVATLLESVLIYLVFIPEHILQLGQLHSLDILRHFVQLFVLTIIILSYLCHYVVACYR